MINNITMTLYYIIHIGRWANNEPNNANTEDEECIEVVNDDRSSVKPDFYWNDNNCQETSYIKFLCESYASFQ